MQTATQAEFRMRPKSQLTLPASIMRRAKYQPDDRLVADFINDTVIIRRKVVAPTTPLNNIMSFAGIGSALWGNTTSEVEATIHNLRASWDR